MREVGTKVVRRMLTAKLYAAFVSWQDCVEDWKDEKAA